MLKGVKPSPCILYFRKMVVEKSFSFVDALYEVEKMFGVQGRNEVEKLLPLLEDIL